MSILFQHICIDVCPNIFFVFIMVIASTSHQTSATKRGFSSCNKPMSVTQTKMSFILTLSKIMIAAQTSARTEINQCRYNICFPNKNYHLISWSKNQHLHLDDNNLEITFETDTNDGKSNTCHLRTRIVVVIFFALFEVKIFHLS